MGQDKIGKSLVHRMSIIGQMLHDVVAQLIGQQLHKRLTQYADRTSGDTHPVVIFAQQCYGVVEMQWITLLQSVDVCGGKKKQRI